MSAVQPLPAMQPLTTANPVSTVIRTCRPCLKRPHTPTDPLQSCGPQVVATCGNVPRACFYAGGPTPTRANTAEGTGGSSRARLPPWGLHSVPTFCRWDPAAAETPKLVLGPQAHNSKLSLPCLKVLGRLARCGRLNLGCLIPEQRAQEPSWLPPASPVQHKDTARTPQTTTVPSRCALTGMPHSQSSHRHTTRTDNSSTLSRLTRGRARQYAAACGSCRQRQAAECLDNPSRFVCTA